MKVSVFLAIFVATCLASPLAGAHGSDDSLENFTCTYKDVEGVWRINTKGEQQTMNSGGYLSFARTKPDSTPQPEELEFVVTGNGFGELEETPSFFKGSCTTIDNQAIYLLTGKIQINGIKKSVIVIPHAADDSKGKDDVCDAYGSPSLQLACKAAAHKYQTKYISISIVNEIETDNETDSSAISENMLEEIMDLGQGHAHGGSD